MKQGEDLPSAYRWVPAVPEEARYNVVAVFDVVEDEWKYQILYGHVFGKGAAVNNFHEVVTFLQAVARRWVMLLLSMYFNDATIQVLGDARGRGQRQFRGVARMLGLPMAQEKQVDMCDQADFMLGQSLPGGQRGHSRGVSSQVCQMGSDQPGASR